jgi:hypothetical protein
MTAKYPYFDPLCTQIIRPVYAHHESTQNGLIEPWNSLLVSDRLTS